MRRVHVFVDESGDEHLSIDRGASSRYVLSAICVQHDKLDGFIQAADEIRRFYFQSGEIKSSKVGSDTRRRSLVLGRLCELEFWSLTFVVTKDRVKLDSGMRFAEPFLKHVARRLCAQLPPVEELVVSFDEKGRMKFKDGFRRYLERNFESRDLFRSVTFEHLNSHGSVGIQVADFLAGSVAKWYADRANFLALGLDRLLRGKTSVLEWPTLRVEGVLPTEGSERYDEIVRRQAYSRAHDYLDRHESVADLEVELRCVFVEWLVSNSALGNSDFLHADEIVRRMNIIRDVAIDAQFLRNRIVGPLRDGGLLIASSTKGYKIPDRLDDLMRYVELCATQIPPAVSRLRRARDALKLSTGGELDILGGAEFAALRSIVEAAQGPVP